MNAITSPEMNTMTAVQIREEFAQKRLQGLRAKDAAEALQLSEGAVIAAHGGEHERSLKAVPLRAEWLDILKGLEACGTVMALTEDKRLQNPAELSVTLELVGQEGSTKH